MKRQSGEPEKLKNIIKYFYCLYKKIDISPLERNGSFIRSIIFLVWGINALFFLTLDFLPQDDFAIHSSDQSISKYTLELSSADVQPDMILIFFSTAVGTISSYNINPHEFEKHFVERGRSPPL